MELIYRILFITAIVMLFAASVTATICTIQELINKLRQKNTHYKFTFSEYIDYILDEVCCAVLTLILNGFVICLLIAGIVNYP